VGDPPPRPCRYRLLVDQGEVHLVLLDADCLVHDVLLLAVLLVSNHLLLSFLWLLTIGGVGVVIGHCLGLIFLASARLLVAGRVRPGLNQTQVFLLHRHSLVESLRLGLGRYGLLLISEHHCLDLLVIEVLKLLLRDLPLLLIPLQEQVVRGSHMVMLICIDTFDGVVLLEVVIH